MRLLHSSGQWIESSLALPATSDPKALAANLTYSRRYLFVALVGVAGDDDLDGEPENEKASYVPRERAASMTKNRSQRTPLLKRLKQRKQQ